MAQTQNIYFEAARRKLRFPSPKGDLTVEQLFSLPMTSTGVNTANLDDMARAFASQLDSSKTRSFVDDSVSEDVNTRLGFDILLDVIAVKKAENKAARERAARKAEVESLMELISKKENEAVAALPVEELRKRLEALTAQQ